MNWTRNFLGGGVQVRASGASSTDARVLSGVPQGSILGPVLFTDLPGGVQSSCKMSADDTKIYDKASHGRRIKADIDTR